MPFENLLIENKQRTRYIIINRESKLNALNSATLNDLHHAFTDAFADSSVGGVIITGAGQKAFVAGADIAELSLLNKVSAGQMARKAQAEVFNLIGNARKPVIAAINGFALGGGLELALACHIRIASSNAKMGLPEVTLGLIPGYGGTQRLAQLIGKGKALEMILTADIITADDAVKIGLINHVTQQVDLVQKAEEIMNKILTRGPLAVGYAIEAVNAANSPAGFEIEIGHFAKCFATDDGREGIAAFLEKRTPNFKAS